MKISLFDLCHSTDMNLYFYGCQIAGYCIQRNCRHRETYDRQIYTQRYSNLHAALEGNAQAKGYTSLVVFIYKYVEVNPLFIQHLFASFLSRDQAYDQLVEIWHVAHPNLNNRSLKAKIEDLEDENDEDENDSDSYSDESDETDSEYDSDEYTEVSDDEDEEADDEGEKTGKLGLIKEFLSCKALTDSVFSEDGKEAPDRQASVHTLPLPAAKDTPDPENRRRAISEVTPRPNAKDLLKPSADGSKSGSTADDSGEKAEASAKAIKHAPTDCECSKGDGHFPQVGLDETYTGTLETIYNLLYNSGFRRKILEEKEKSTGRLNNNFVCY